VARVGRQDTPPMTFVRCTAAPILNDLVIVRNRFG